MPIYIILGPAAALIGIVAVFFVMRHKSVQTRSMYSSRRSQIERKVRSARQRTLAPSGHSNKPPTPAEIAAAAPAMDAPAYAPRQSWDAPATPAQTFAPPAPAPEYSPPAQAPEYSPPPPPPAAPFSEQATPAPAQPEWRPGPSEGDWTPRPSPATDPGPPPEPAPPREPVSSPSGAGASWEIVGEAPAQQAAAEPPKGKKDKGQTTSQWQLASGAVADEDAEDEVRKPSAAMALAQYAVLVVGLVMVLIGVLVMVANSKVT
jgi:hypothetical protein